MHLPKTRRAPQGPGNGKEGAKFKAAPEGLLTAKSAREQRNAKIREAYAKGKKQVEIAAEYGLKQQTVSLICKDVEKKVKPKRKVNQAIQERNAKIREAYAEGRAVEEIAREYKLAPLTTYRICRGVERKGIPKRPKKKDPVKAQRDRWIREAYAKGKTQTEIAKEHGISQSYVSIICKGVESPKKERNRKIRKAFAEGKKRREIAEEHGISIPSVSLICRGVKRKVEPRKNPERDRQIREAYARGKKQREIAEERGLSVQRVSEICKGVESPRKRRGTGR